jgi:tetratricopeptide (TPR) repeat protein
LWSYGFAVAVRSPEKARAAFQEVLRAEPSQPQALYGLAQLAAAAGHDDEALAYLDRALAADPESVEARRGRAVILARRGDWERAGRDINRCLERDPSSGETLYAAACVASRAAEALGDPRAADQALRLLRQALDHGVARDRAAGDPDLAGSRRHPEFRKVISAPPPAPLADGI